MIQKWKQITIVPIITFSFILMGCTGNYNDNNSEISDSGNIQTNPSSYDEETSINDVVEVLDIDEGLDLIEYANERINTVLESMEYKEASLEEREQIIRQLMTELRNAGAIRHFSFFRDNHLFSYEYSDGSLGGVRIKDFDPLFNSY